MFFTKCLGSHPISVKHFIYELHKILIACTIIEAKRFFTTLGRHNRLLTDNLQSLLGLRRMVLLKLEEGKKKFERLNAEDVRKKARQSSLFFQFWIRNTGNLSSTIEKKTLRKLNLI